jgi:hypothetical protein
VPGTVTQSLGSAINLFTNHIFGSKGDLEPRKITELQSVPTVAATASTKHNTHLTPYKWAVPEYHHITSREGIVPERHLV